MLVKGDFLNTLLPQKKYKDDDFYPEEEMEPILTSLSPVEQHQKGLEIFKRFIRTAPEGFQSIQHAFVDFYRIFSHYLKGEGIGMVRALQFRPGIMSIGQNLNLPCDLVQGVLRGMMDYFNARGVSIRHNICRKEGAPLCEYNVTWMTSNV
jgi:hypothetical protein